jgi:hypothetical protein
MYFMSLIPIFVCVYYGGFHDEFFKTLPHEGGVLRYALWLHPTINHCICICYVLVFTCVKFELGLRGSACKEAVSQLKTDVRAKCGLEVLLWEPWLEWRRRSCAVLQQVAPWIPGAEGDGCHPTKGLWAAAMLWWRLEDAGHCPGRQWLKIMMELLPRRGLALSGVIAECLVFSFPCGRGDRTVVGQTLSWLWESGGQ